MLPGFDFGDTASFQTIVGAPLLRPRDAYPLYFAVGKVFVWLCGAEADPASALNLASAVCGAAACGVLAIVCARMTTSVSGGLFGGLLVASSYTFWSQAVIAEVYALHVLLIGLCLAALLRYADGLTSADNDPTGRDAGNLFLFFLIYAVSFGNHLSMILLLPGFTAFLIAVTPGGVAALLTRRVAALSGAAVLIGACQYLWNAAELWTSPDAPSAFADRLAAFWFDVTKSDWRESLVGAVPAMRASERLAMWWFDLKQQFGVVGIAFGVLGAAWLVRYGRPAAVMLLVNWSIASAFALTYNVGDTHVFFLPAHVMLAIAAACGAAALVRNMSGTVRLDAALLSAVALAYPAYRVWDTYPAVDRSRDTRPSTVLAQLTNGLTSRELYLTALSWEVQNGLDYYTRYLAPDVVQVHVRDVLPHFAFLLWDNEADGRRFAATRGARDEIVAAYGALVHASPDERVMVTPPDGWPGATGPHAYVLAFLTPTRDYGVDEAAVRRLAQRVGGVSMPGGDYAVVAGRTGTPPSMAVGDGRPFRARSEVDGLEIEVRMESFLTFDTIRRAGFGHVVVNGRHALTIERGVSYVELDASGRAVRTLYAGNIFAPEGRWLVRSATSTP